MAVPILRAMTESVLPVSLSASRYLVMEIYVGKCTLVSVRERKVLLSFVGGLLLALLLLKSLNVMDDDDNDDDEGGGRRRRRRRKR